MFNKGFTALFLAGTTALAGCVGGGGGGPKVEFDPPTISPTTNIGQLGVVNGVGEIVSALVTMTEDNQISMQEIVQAFEFVENNPNIDTSDLSKYTIKIDGVEKNLSEAWDMLRGYKKLFYDDRKAWWKNVANTGKLDTEAGELGDVTGIYMSVTDEDILNVGDGTKKVDDVLEDIGFKPKPEEPKPEEPKPEEPKPEEPKPEEPVVVETGRTTENTVNTSTTVTESASDPVVTTTYIDSEEVTKKDNNTVYTTYRTYTDTTTVTTVTIRTVTTTTTPVTTITYSNGTSKTITGKTTTSDNVKRESKDTVSTAIRREVISTRTVPNDPEEPVVVETDRTTNDTVTTSEDVSTSETPVVVTTHVDTTSNVVQENGDTVYTTTRTYTDTTTTTTVVTTVTTTNTTPVTTVTYSDGSKKTINGNTTVSQVSNSVSTEAVTTAQRTEVLKTWTVPATVLEVVDTDISYGGKIWSHVEKTYGDPVVTTDDVVTYEGTWKVTTRNTTTTTTQWHEHFDNQEQTTTLTYSDGSKKTTTETVLVSRGKVQKPDLVTVTSQEISRINSDDGVIGDDHVDMGTRTPGFVSNPAHYRTQEFGDHLSTSGFDIAYSRGWTGKGSLVVIADTGADTSHVDLNDNIAHTIDYTGSGISNSSWHGSHVAGIVGAEKNGTGMHGAAFDADLAIAKVADGYNYSFSNARKAAAWGNGLGAVAINVSAEVNYDKGFRSSIIKDAHGVWHSDHWYYGTNGYNGAVNEARLWKEALGDEMVLVKAAGNAGWDYSAGMNQMATATDSNGNLILDGQMIIVGNYDDGNHYGNKAGTVCATYVDGACTDVAKIKDFYILADGVNVESIKSGGGYTTLTGTSMAAPVVSGAIGVLHQMWPHMKGKHLVDLVLTTASEHVLNSYGENIYDENLHGHGLLDMDRATRPVGATGIPTSGRTNGGVSVISGGANVSGVAASQLSALTDVMVLDSYERDFYVDLTSIVGSDINTRTASVAGSLGLVNYYSGYMNSDQHLAVPIKVASNSWVDVGVGNSDGHYLGNSFEGVLGTSKSSSTVYANYNFKSETGMFGQFGLGLTDVNMDKSGSMLKDTSKVISSTWTLGYEFQPQEDHNWGVTVSQPVTVEHAKFKYSIPSARTLDGDVVSSSQNVDFSSSSREIDLGTYYSFNIQKTTGLDADIKLFAEMRNTVGNIAKEVEKRAGFSVQLKF